MAETRQGPSRWVGEGQAADPSLRVQVQHLDGGATLRLVGEFDLTGIEAFERSARSLVFRYDGRQIDIDCSELQFIDAAGVGQLVRVASSVQEGPVRLLAPSARVRQVLHLTGTDVLFDLTEPFDHADASGAAMPTM